MPEAGRTHRGRLRGRPALSREGRRRLWFPYSICGDTVVRTRLRAIDNCFLRTFLTALLLDVDVIPPAPVKLFP